MTGSNKFFLLSRRLFEGKQRSRKAHMRIAGLRLTWIRRSTPIFLGRTNNQCNSQPRELNFTWRAMDSDSRHFWRIVKAAVLAGNTSITQKEMPFTEQRDINLGAKQRYLLRRQLTIVTNHQKDADSASISTRRIVYANLSWIIIYSQSQSGHKQHLQKPIFGICRSSMWLLARK